MANTYLTSIIVVATTVACSAVPKTSSPPKPATSAVPVASGPVEPVETKELDWCMTKSPCTEGAALKGSPPPAGKFVSCELNGVAQGPRTEFHASGKPARSDVYSQGKLQGRHTQWYATGTVEEEGNYRNGL